MGDAVVIFVKIVIACSFCTRGVCLVSREDFALIPLVVAALIGIGGLCLI